MIIIGNSYWHIGWKDIVVQASNWVCTCAWKASARPLGYHYASTLMSCCFVSGWGQTSPGGMLAEALRKVDVKVIDQKKCMASEENVTDRQICTYTPGKDSCQVWIEKSCYKIRMVVKAKDLTDWLRSSSSLLRGESRIRLRGFPLWQPQI